MGTIPPIILTVLDTIIFILLCSTTYLLYALITKKNAIKKMNETHNQLMRSFNDLDEQAKMIVHTDFELNKIREEMSKRLNGLSVLQKTSRQINQALDENEIFQRISPALFEDLGFTRVLIASVDDSHALNIRLTLGYADARAKAILKEIDAEDLIKLSQTEASFLSSIDCSDQAKEKIVRAFEAEHFIFSPILTQKGSIGFVFAGNLSTAPEITQADEELITILTGQIGQSIENAQLFEKVFHSSQELELKVVDRTKQLAGALQKVNDIRHKKSEFVSAVSHELRTPLTTIKGAAILIAEKMGEVPASVKERLAKINSHSDSLVTLVNNLSDIARIESGRQEMKFATHKVKNIVDKISELLSSAMRTKDIKLHLRLSQPIEEVYVDASHAERVLIILLNNAVKFTPQHGTITIAVAPTLDSGYAVFSVSDTGIGIPASEIQKLFNEFFRIDNEINQNVKGTGLGLVLARNIIQAHRGKIWVQSQVRVGTTFYFTLPSSQQSFEEHLAI